MIVEILGLVVGGASAYIGWKQFKIAATSKGPLEDASADGIFFDENRYRAYVKRATYLLDLRGIAAQDPENTKVWQIPIDKVYAQLCVKSGLSDRDTDIQEESTSPRATL